MIPISVYIFILVELAAVSYLDIKERKILNYWSIINLVCFILFLFLFPAYFKMTFDTFIYPMAFLIIGFILFALKIMGAGDVKYLFSLFFLIPRPLQDHFFMILLWTTIIIGSASLLVTFIQNIMNIIQAVRNYDLISIRKLFGSKFAYAPVIFISWIWVGWILRKKIFFA